MVSYDSKAWIEPVEFPLIIFNTDSTFEIFQEKLLLPNLYNQKKLDTLILKGRINMQSDSLLFNIENGKRLVGIFTDKSKKNLKVSGLIDIGIESNYGNFKKVE